MNISPTAYCLPPTAYCFSLYIHIPYCPSKCPYCDFNSYAASRWPEREYVAALTAELAHYANHRPWNGAHLHTIFFGGGTPSMFAPDSIAQILATARELWPAQKSIVDSQQSIARNLVGGGRRAIDYRLSTIDSPEITLEANPGTVTLDKLRGFRAAGVNRMSFGVQSFNPTHLARLGRVHSAEEAVAAIRLARAADFENINLDLIFAVPGQTLAEWDSDVRTAVSIGPDHVSVYNLTYEEGTAFHVMRGRGEILPLAEEIEIAMFVRAQDVLQAGGYEQYEISNYARHGRQCRHNLNYWRAGQYLGIGAGAHSFARTSDLPIQHDASPVASHESSITGGGHRWSNEKNPTLYIARVESAGHARVAGEDLTRAQAAGEFVFLGLRCLDGIDSRAFAERFGADFVTVFPHSEPLRREGLLVADGDHWRLSDRGLLVADSVFATYL